MHLQMRHRSSTQVSTVVSAVKVPKEGWLYITTSSSKSSGNQLPALSTSTAGHAVIVALSCAGPSAAQGTAARVGRRRSPSFSGTSEPTQGFSGGPSYGWGEGGSGYTTGAAAAAAAAGGRKQLHDRQGGSGYTIGAAAAAAAAASGGRKQLYKPAPGEAEHMTCSTRWGCRVYTRSGSDPFAFLPKLLQAARL
jgi:hypothetical protein